MASEPVFHAANARLAWADGHIERLRALVDEYAAPALQVTEAIDPERAVITHTAIADGEPPPAIALCLGDALQQLRATLDTAVHALRSERPTRSTAFPVESDEKKWPTTSARALNGVPEWAVEVIRSIQPFAKSPWSAVGDGLGVLHELAIRDRHHALLLSLAIAELGHVEVDVETKGLLYRPGAAPRTFVTEYPFKAHPRPHFAVEVHLVERDIKGGPPFPEVVAAAESAEWAVRTTLWLLEEGLARHSASKPERES